MSTAEEKFREDLTAHLLEVATGNGYLNGILLNTPDLDEAWQRYAPSFYPDAVREFNGYPEFCLACAADILKEGKHCVAAMQSLSAATYHFLMKSGAEAGTAEAYRLFLVSIEVLYKIGAAIELARLGYSFEKVG